MRTPAVTVKTGGKIMFRPQKDPDQEMKIYLSFIHDSIYMFDDLTLLFTFE